MLGSKGGRRNTLGFVIGWMLCAGVVAVLTVLVAGGTSHSGHVSAAIGSAGLLQIGLGVAALALLLVRRRRRAAALVAAPGAPTPEPETPDGPERVVGPVGAALIAAMLQGWP